MAATDTKTQASGAQAQMASDSNRGKEVARAMPPEQRRRLTVAEERAAKRDMLIDAAEAARGEITKLLTPFNIDFEFFMAGLRLALMRTMQTDANFFNEVRPETFVEAVFRGAKDGLICDGKEAAIGRFKDVATYMPMRNGFVKVLWRTGMIREINDNVVTRKEYDKGDFEYEEGDEGFIRHKKDLERTDKDEVVAAYCVIKLTNGGKAIEIVPKADLEKIAKTAKSQEARNAWKLEMDRKAAIRRIMKKMPQERAIVQLLEHDDQNYDPKLAAPNADRQPVPRAALFDDRAAIRREPDAPAPERDPPHDRETSGPQDDARTAEPDQDSERQADASADDQDVRQTSQAVIDAVSAIMHAGSLGELATAIHDAWQACPVETLSEADKEWLLDAIEKQTAKLKPEEPKPDPEADKQPDLGIDTDQGPPLVAKLTSAAEPREYDDPGLWQADILSKMAALNGQAKVAFWRQNRDFVYRAKGAGHETQADRILKVAIDQGLERTEEAGA